MTSEKKSKQKLKDACVISGRINEELGQAFDEKSSADEISKKDFIETAVKAYVNGSAKRLFSSGKVLRIQCEVEEIEY